MHGASDRGRGGGEEDEEEEESQQQLLIPGLPDDLALRCLARAARQDHSALRSVCRRWCQILTSEQLPALRRGLGVAEGWLYALSRDKSECLSWHVLDPSKRKWMELPRLPEDLAGKFGLTCAVLGRELFVMGGCDKYEEPTAEVWRYDALKNRWSGAPRMEVARCHFVSGSSSDRLYAIGGMGLVSGALTSWEIFDKEKNHWSLYNDPNIVSDLGESLVLDGRIYVRHASPGIIPPFYAAVYDPQANAWDALDNQMTRQWCGPAVAVGGDVYMLDQTLGIKLMVLNRATGEWNTVGRLSPHSIRTPCRIAAVGKNLYVVGRGLKTMVLNLEEAGKHRGLLVTSSIEGLRSVDDVVVSCNVIEL
ncbi:hypothetical protein SELMODRAFT_122034 [Selaginella moellendorffii]|uniref:F-box domain-containing protein n=1 Tax=Selaginella moellendorffii TaxID=88036 RepID=D8SPE2_SELML|nr:F-box/kelch-repeat protein SKIP4 [Selaginella moellendorffii]EFJ13650.1 hypothetical protein SELMODRAFT_122034 [Selaginella moellendorffii]|eukprot:XP_002985156.1 F-box/kelch-repeat protein SKIP4 [Selaginella moellendorffii]